MQSNSKIMLSTAGLCVCSALAPAFGVIAAGSLVVMAAKNERVMSKLGASVGQLCRKAKELRNA